MTHETISTHGFKMTQEGSWAKDPARQARRVVVTGMSLITPLGNDTETSWNNLISSNSGLRNVTVNEVADRSGFPKLGNLKTNVTAAAFVDIDIKEEFRKILPEGFVKKLKFDRMGDTTQLALLASVQALQNAGLIDEDHIIDGVNRDRFGVRIGTLIGNTAQMVKIHERVVESYNDPRITNNGIRSNDTLITDPARISAMPSIIFGLQGPKETTIAACASGNLALIGAYQDIFAGDADIMLVGGADYKIDPFGIGNFETLTALSAKDQSHDATKSKPLDKSANGFVLAEGAGMFVLETLEHAIARQTKIIVEFAGYSKASDGKYDTAPTGHAAQYGLAETLSRSGLPDKGIISINSHTTGTKADGLEVLNYKKTLDQLPVTHEVAISATKASTGHMLGATGAVEAGFAMLAVDRGIVPPTIGIENPIDEVQDLNIVPNEAQKKDVGLGINGNYAFGGGGAVTAFRKLR